MSNETAKSGFKVAMKEIIFYESQSWPACIKATKRHYGKRDWGIATRDDLEQIHWYGDKHFSDFGSPKIQRLVKLNKDKYVFWDANLAHGDGTHRTIFREPSDETIILFYWNRKDYEQTVASLESRFTEKLCWNKRLKKRHNFTWEQIAWVGCLYWYQILRWHGWFRVRVTAKDGTQLLNMKVMECPQYYEKIVDALEAKGLKQDQVIEIMDTIREEHPEQPWTL